MSVVSIFSGAACLLALLCTFVFGTVSAHPGGVDHGGCHRASGTGERHCHPERATSAKQERTDHSPRAGDEGVFYGPVVYVVDGDTFKVRVQGVVMDFRLESVDAPEHDQPYGKQATAELRKLINGTQLVLVPSDTDRYGRTIVRAWVGDMDINLEMVRRGAAWFDSEYSKDDLLYQEEIKARAAKQGLWALALKDRVEPWSWRRVKR